MRRLTALALGIAAAALTAAGQSSSVTITTTLLPDAQANQSYSYQIQTSGGSGQFTWSITNGTLPSGIVLDIGTGLLEGTAPGISASYTFTARVLDLASAQSASQVLTLNVVGGLEIITMALPNAYLNQPYSFQLVGMGSPSMTWSLQSGALPQGFSLDPTGLITGLGTDVGSSSFVIKLQDLDGQISTSRSFTLYVTRGPLGIQQSSLPTATQRAAYSFVLTGQGGIPPYMWSVDTPNGAGLSINASTGVLSGTPPNAGTFPVLVSLQDFTGDVFSETFSLNVGAAVAITKISLANGSPGAPYSDTLTAAYGVLTYRWNVISGTLPAGLTLNSSTGQITGTPTTQGTSRFTIQVTDFVGGTDSKAFTITIGQGLVITTTSLPDGGVGQLYSQTLAVTGGAAPLTWTIASGTLPPPLTLNSATGVISGTPTTLGTFAFDVAVTDAGGASGRKSFSIRIANPVVITSGNFTGNVLTAFSQTLTAAGGTPPYTWSLTAGTLPAGLQLNSATGVISGTPSAGGTSEVTFAATDAGGQTGLKTVSITINLPAPPATTIGLGSTAQPAVSLSTGTPYPLEITGSLTLTFAPLPGGTDGGEARFSNGTRSLAFTVPANTTQATFPTAPNAAVLTGTVAGTITLTASMKAGGQDITPSPAPTKTITIDSAVPVITSVALQQVSGGITVVVTGYSNTRDVSSGTFSFTVSSGNTAPAPIVVSLTSAFTAWFSNAASNPTGGQFKLTVPFSVTQGSAAAVTKVAVTLTNSKGASGAVSSP